METDDVWQPYFIHEKWRTAFHATACGTGISDSGKWKSICHAVWKDKGADVTDYIPGHYEIASMKFIYQNGSVANVGSGVAGEKIAVDVREGLVTSIEIDVR